MTDLIHLDAAHRELMQADTAHEVLHVLKKASSFTEIAKKMGMGHDMQNAGAELKLRCQRKLGGILQETEFNKGAATPSHDDRALSTLKDLGLTHSDSSRFQKIHSIDEDLFEGELSSLKEKGEEITTNYFLRLHVKTSRPPVTETPSYPENTYSLIYMDPPWRYEHSKTVTRDIENQYPTMTHEELLDLYIPARDNCILFVWATPPKLEEALELIHAWGFTYRTCSVWDKEVIGMGYYFRQQHELLLVAVKGAPGTPPESARVSSVHRERRGKHSKKPEYYYSLIEGMYPEAVKLEMFARKARAGWEAWGNEL